MSRWSWNRDARRYELRLGEAVLWLYGGSGKSAWHWSCWPLGILPTPLEDVSITDEMMAKVGALLALEARLGPIVEAIGWVLGSQRVKLPPPLEDPEDNELGRMLSEGGIDPECDLDSVAPTVL